MRCRFFFGRQRELKLIRLYSFIIRVARAVPFLRPIDRLNCFALKSKIHAFFPVQTTPSDHFQTNQASRNTFNGAYNRAVLVLHTVLCCVCCGHQPSPSSDLLLLSKLHILEEEVYIGCSRSQESCSRKTKKMDNYLQTHRESSYQTTNDISQ